MMTALPLAMAAAACRQGAQLARVLVQLGLRHLGDDHFEAPLGFHAHDPPAAPGKVGHHRTHRVRGNLDAQQHDRLQQTRGGQQERLIKGGLAGDLEGDVLGVDRVLLAVVEIHFHVGDGEAGIGAMGAGGMDALFDGGDEHAVDVAANQ